MDDASITAPGEAPIVEKRHRCFSGSQFFCRHQSASTQSTMRFSLYLPPRADRHKVPLLVWLSGLTCTEETFPMKAGAQRIASRLGLALLAPDTSPRVRLPGDDENWDFGLGAGFYLDAREEPWSAHYRMESYVVHELPALVASHFPVDAGRAGLFGHSMGGHGALVLGLRHPERFLSLSAFAPIAAATRSPWGRKALPRYLGPDPAAWRAHDAAALMEDLEEPGQRPILVDQGLDDAFLEEQLKPTLFEAACAQRGYPLELRRHEGYDHSYYFIASFIEDHLRHHAAALGLP